MINREHAALYTPAHSKEIANNAESKTATTNNPLSKTLIVGTVTALIFILPWIFTTFTEEYYEITKNALLLIGVSILIMVWGVTTIIKKRVILFKTPIDWAVFAIVVVAILSTIFSVNSDTSIWGFHMRLTGGLVSTLILAGIYYLIVNTINSKSTVIFLLNSVVYSLSILAIFTILKSLGLLDFVFSRLTDTSWSYMQSALFTPTGNPNSLTFLFIIGLPLSLFLFVNNKAANTKQSVIGILSSLVFIIASALTTISTFQDVVRIITWLLILAVVAVSTFYVKNNIKTQQKTLGFNIALLIVAVLGGFFALSTDVHTQFSDFLKNTLKTEYNFSRYYDIPSNTSMAVMGGAINPAKPAGTTTKYDFKSFIIGNGLDTYAYVFPQYRPVEQNSQLNWYDSYTRSNTQIESIITNTGLVGGLISFGLLVYFIVKFLMAKIVKPGLYTHSRELLGLMLLIIVFLCSFFLVYHTLTLLFFCWILTALGFKLYMMENPEEAGRVEAEFKLVSRLDPKKSISLAPYLFTGVLAVAAVIGIFSVTVNFFAEKYFSDGLKASATSNFDEAYDKFVAAVNINSTRDYYHREIASVALSKMDAVLEADKENTTKTDEQKQQALTAQNYLLTLINSEINKSILLNPENDENWQRAAVIYKRLTELAQGKQFGNETLQAISQAINQNPNNPDNYLLLGYIYQFNADDKLKTQAEQAYLKAYDLQPSYALSIIQLGGYLEFVEKYADALKLYQISKEQIYTTESPINKYLVERIDAMNKKIAEKNAPVPTATPTPVVKPIATPKPSATKTPVKGNQ